MKKRLSLLLATLMVISLLPISSFAAATPSTANPTVEPGTKRNIGVTFELPTNVELLTGSLRLELDNGAVFTSAGTFAATLANNLGGTTIATSNPVSNIGYIEFGAAKATANPVGSKILINFVADVIFGDTDGPVNLKVVDQDNNNVGNHTVQIAQVKTVDVSDLSIDVKDAEKAVSYDGGKLSQFEIKNFKNIGSATTMTLTLDEGVRFDKPNSTVIIDGQASTGTVGADPSTMEINVTSKTKSVIVIPAVTLRNSVPAGSVRVAAKSGSQNSSAFIGKVVDYNVTMKIVENGKKEIPSVWGGETAKIKVTLKGPKGSISNGKWVDFVLDGAKIKFANKPAGSDADQDKDGYVKDGKFSIQATSDEKMEFVVEIETDYDKDGMATLKASQRSWDASADAAKVTPKFSVKAEATPVKKGESKASANVVITEAKVGLLNSSDKITLKFDTRRDYTEFVDHKIKVESTNGMTFGDVEKIIASTGSKELIGLSIPVKRSSVGEPAVITISGLKVLVDGSATDDTVKLEVGLKGNKVSDPEYIKVVKEYALESILTVFTIGQTQYTKNGQAMTAASAPYIKNGKTMLPIRAIAESLGLTVQWNGATKTATFSDATKVAMVTIGAEKMYVNGTPIPLAAKAELVNGTTFVELRSLATAFGVQIDWDAAAKTATVSK